MPILGNKKPRYVVKSKERAVEVERKAKHSQEDRFYWTRVITAIVTAIVGTFGFHLVGWGMLLYLVCFWLGFPWIVSFIIFRIPYEKGVWDWKMIEKTGIGAFFFLFMLIATICHTMIVLNDPVLDYVNIFANPA